MRVQSYNTTYARLLKRMHLRTQRRNKRRLDVDCAAYRRIDGCRRVYPRFQEGAYHE